MIAAQGPMKSAKLYLATAMSILKVHFLCDRCCKFCVWMTKRWMSPTQTIVKNNTFQPMTELNKTK
jgi:hypothetical protein